MAKLQCDKLVDDLNYHFKHSMVHAQEFSMGRISSAGVWVREGICQLENKLQSGYLSKHFQIVVYQEIPLWVKVNPSYWST